MRLYLSFTPYEIISAPTISTNRHFLLFDKWEHQYRLLLFGMYTNKKMNSENGSHRKDIRKIFNIHFEGRQRKYVFYECRQTSILDDNGSCNEPRVNSKKTAPLKWCLIGFSRTSHHFHKHRWEMHAPRGEMRVFCSDEWGNWHHSEAAQLVKQLLAGLHA